MKFFKVIRFDSSDDNVFPKGAVADEWAVSGAFEFGMAEPGELTGKYKQAFSNGVLGLNSWGRSTFVTVAEMPEAEYELAVERLIDYFVQELSAPSRKEAEPYAREEVDYIVEMCSEKPINTLFAVRRFVDEDDNMREAFHEITRKPGETDHARIWEMVPDDD